MSLNNLAIGVYRKGLTPTHRPPPRRVEVWILRPAKVEISIEFHKEPISFAKGPQLSTFDFRLSTFEQDA
jgi:hypothetical protein